MAFASLLSLLGLVGGFVSGLLGIGGAILMIPLLLFVPPRLGFAALPMGQIAAISMVQVFFASLAAVWVHRRNNCVSRPLVLSMGTASALGSLAGAQVSVYLPGHFLLQLFAAVSTAAALLMFLPKRPVEAHFPADAIPFNRPLAVVIALAVGAVGGAIGAAGAFIYVPLLIYVLAIPTRVALGSTLAIVLLSSLAGMAGKVTTGQVPFLLALALVIGAVPGAQVGSRLSRYVDVKLLRWMVTAIIILSTLRVWRLALGAS